MPYTASSARLTVLLPVELTLDGLREAKRQLAELETRVTSVQPADRSAAAEADVIALYKHLATRLPPSKTVLLLHLFAQSSDLLTPDEIGAGLGRGQPLPKGSARAVLRNLSRTQRNLLES